jgi:hypothetical protein
MKIWGLGLSKTGIVSLKSYLKTKDINIVKYPSKNEMFLGDNDGAIDLPVIVHYKELDLAFPNSKFILTERNLDDWYTSISRWFLNRVVPDEPRFAGNRHWRTAVFGNPNPNPVNIDYIDVYENHIKDVENYFSDRPDDLLRIKICEGDTPQKLCEFLGIDYKKEEVYPHLHKSVAGNYDREELL